MRNTTSGKSLVVRVGGGGSGKLKVLSPFLFSDHRESADAVCRHLIKELPNLLHKGETGRVRPCSTLRKSGRYLNPC
jgi:hypothetical protein